VREVAIEAIERARRGDGPTLIEAQTYRFRGHSLADPDELREKKEKDYWQVLSLHHPSCLYASPKKMQLNACMSMQQHVLCTGSVSGRDKSSYGRQFEPPLSMCCQ